MTWNDLPNLKPQPRKQPSSSRQEPPWSDSTGPAMTGCKQNILGSTPAQMTDTIVCALGMFQVLYVPFLPQVTIIYS